MDFGNREKNWFSSKHSKICSAHFQEQDFNPTRKRRVLLDHAYPTIHVWTTSENVSDIQVNVTPSKSPSPSMSSKSIKRAIQLDPDIMETPRKRKMQRIINEKENVIKTQRSKIKCLQGTNGKPCNIVNKMYYRKVYRYSPSPFNENLSTKSIKKTTFK
ncbi:unnamed protein product [Parnassius apollo]|uniref:(apollo) hypothetical protein n=1 Tax=Parnassius apollo TaxID=110799 RepID=A0A8S3WBX3_PARAO|nr:unnamed protein product [Parnassius apollo]